MTDGRRNSSRWAAGVIAGAIVVASCGSDGGAADDEPITVPPQLSTTTSTTPADTTTTTEPGLPAEQLVSCVENAKLQAFLGNEFWAQMWSEADMTDAGMTGICRFLFEDDPAGLFEIHVAFQGIGIENTDGDGDGGDEASSDGNDDAGNATDDNTDTGGGETSSAVSTTTPAPTTTVLAASSLDAAGSVASDLSLVAGCTAWVEFFNTRGVARAVELWTEAGGSTSAVRALCTAIAEQDPVEASLMRDEMEGSGP